MYNAGIQLHGSKKSILNPVQQINPVQKKKISKERLKKLLAKKDFLDKKTLAYLEKHGLINTNI